MPLITSSRSTVAQAVLPVAQVWIKDPLDPVRNVRVFHGEKFQNITKKRVRGVFTPLGRKKALVVSGEANYESFTFVGLTLGDVAYEALEQMLDSNRTLQLVMPKRYWYVQVSGDYDFDEDEWSPTEPTARRWSIPFVEVDRFS